MNAETSSLFMTEVDHEFFKRELSSFVPDKVFDAHSHIWKRAHVGTSQTESFNQFPNDVGYDEYRNAMGELLPGRHLAALFIPCGFTAEYMMDGNEWVAEQSAKHPQFRGSFFIRPSDDPEWVREQVRRLKLKGIKCYHTWTNVTPTWEANIPDYLPEPIVRIADEEQLVITLHMVKSRAVADPENIKWIRHYCETYPRMKLVLAHSARGFQPSHNFEGLPKLTDLDNLYCDNSANCESIAHESIIRILGHKRLLFGSDFLVSHLRGRSVAVADTFLWLYEETPVWGEKHTHINPVLTGFEHLRSLKWACWSARLSDAEVEDIFWNNARDLFQIE